MTEKKNKILTIAQGVFARFGIHKTTMDEIAKKSRIGKATLYYYFKNKEDVFREVIQKESIIFKETIKEELKKAKTPKEKITTYILTRMKILKKLSNYYEALIVKDYYEHYKFIEEERKDFTNYETNLFESILIDGMCENIFEVDNPKQTAQMIIIAMKGLEFPLIIENSSNDIERDIDLLVKILLKGLEVR
jgi:AcrR family transcriptional regulator